MQTTSDSRPVRVRIAPSPTGDPHVGTAYIGLINMVFARQYGGQFILRIEDTDQGRSTRAYEEAIFASLRWFGLEWDEGPDVGGPYGPYRQSERTELYRAHAEMLIEGGQAYRCFCTPDRLEALRAQQREAKLNPGYDRHCRDLSPQAQQEALRSGIAFVVRLKMPLSGESVVADRLRGEVRFDNLLIDDQVLVKSDGFPTYHLANVVDDHLMNITHVIRAEEWISSTPKHVRLYEAFGWQAPQFVHMPLLRNQDRSKISKRKNPVSLLYYQDVGFLPEALLNFLALMGWTPRDGRERFSLQEMIEEFDIDRISLGGPVFDMAKLKWLNGQYIRELPEALLGDRLQEVLFSRARLDRLVPLVRERMETLEDFWQYADFFFLPAVRYEAQLEPKKRSSEETRTMLAEVLQCLEDHTRTGWTAGNLELALRSYCESSGEKGSSEKGSSGDSAPWKMKDVFMAVRVAVTGKSATPGLFETLELLGRERTRRRFQAADFHLKKRAEVTPS